MVQKWSRASTSAAGHAAVEVGADVVRLGRRRVVDVAADVAVEVLGLDLARWARGGRRPGSRRARRGERAVGVDDARDVLGAEEVLRLALAVVAVGVDEDDVLALGGACLVHDQDAGRDAGAVEEAGGQADDRLEPAALDEVAARLALVAAAEEHAVGHDGGHLAVGLEHGQHVLDEHEVGLLALLGHPDGEAAGVLDVLLDVVLAEGRIGEDAVEALELAVLVLVLRAADGVLLPDVGVGDAVQQHVHLADRPGGADLLLAGEREVARVAAGLADVVAGLDEHAARAARWGRRCSCRPGARRSRPWCAPRRPGCRTRRPSCPPSRRST